MALIARRRRYTQRPPRNTAPLWKKLTIVATAVVAVLLVMSVLNANHTGFFTLVVVVIAVIAGVVWGMAKLLGVHISLSSWD